ncbi:MAG: carboxypeptidase-like regulatory domain-containing protein, partial [Ferruginibacter sp.]|nr:carboxypeptidase-like regulatory domain-containing protein [Ferruginibacter sp.]
MIKTLLLILVLLTATIASAQEKFTISGYLRDVQNGETLIGAAITVAGTSKGIVSNQYGFYSLTLNEGTYELIGSYTGFQPQLIKLKLYSDKQLNFDLQPRAALAEVIVTSKKRDANVKNAQMGRFVLPIEQIKAIPAFLGEVDLLKTVQLLPGVRNAGEGSAGIYVRGGGPD